MSAAPHGDTRRLDAAKTGPPAPPPKPRGGKGRTTGQEPVDAAETTDLSAAAGGAGETMDLSAAGTSDSAQAARTEASKDTSPAAGQDADGGGSGEDTTVISGTGQATDASDGTDATVRLDPAAPTGKPGAPSGDRADKTLRRAPADGTATSDETTQIVPSGGTATSEETTRLIATGGTATSEEAPELVSTSVTSEETTRLALADEATADDVATGKPAGGRKAAGTRAPGKHEGAPGRHEGAAGKHEPTPRRPAPPVPARSITDPGELTRTLRQLWGSVAALAALAFLLRLAITYWVQPLAWNLPSAAGMLVVLGATLLAAAVPVALFGVRMRQLGRLPRAFQVGRDRWHRSWRGASSRLGARPASRPAAPVFVVPFSPWLGAYAILAMAIVAGAIEPGPDGRWLPAVPMVEAFAAVATWFAFRGPHVALSADGLIVRRWWSGPAGIVVPWDSVRAEALPAPSRQERHLAVPVTDPDGTERTVRLSVGWLWVHPAFLLCAIEHYAEYDDHRMEIGTADELRRLTRAIGRDLDAAVSAAGTP